MAIVRFRLFILILGLASLVLGCKQPEKDEGCDSSSASEGTPGCTGSSYVPELQLVSPQITRLSSISLLVSGVDCGLTPVLAFEVSTEGAGTIFKNVDCRADVSLAFDELESDLTYNVRAQATNSDSSSKSEFSNTVSFTYDNLPPQITLIGNATISLSAGDAYIELGATAFDSLDQNISSEIEIEQNLSSTDVGIQYVTYSISDNAGNMAIKKRKVVYDYCSVGNRQSRGLDENLFGGSFIVCSFEQLEQVAREVGPLTLTANYKLGKDIDASPTAAPSYNGGKGWDPIGLVSQNGGFTIGPADQIYEDGHQKIFGGNFDGSGFEISNLFIRNGIGATGFFAGIGKGLYEPPFPVVKRLKLNNVDIVGGRHTGGLTGWVRYSNIENIHVSGGVSAGSPYSYSNPTQTGGIIGGDDGGNTLKKLRADVQVTGYSSVGGIAGGVRSNLMEVSSSGQVEGVRSVGGIAGHAGTLNITDSFSDMTVVRSFTLEVCSDYQCNIGGLIGVCQYSCDVKRSHFSGRASSQFVAGGLIGYTTTLNRISNSFSIGFLDDYNSSSNTIGTVVGRANSISTGAFSNSFWFHEAGYSGSQVKKCIYPSSGQSSTFEGCSEVADEDDFQDKNHAVYQETEYSDPWDFEEIWLLEVGELPQHRWLLNF